MIIRHRWIPGFLVLAILVTAACNRQYSVTLNNQTIYTPAPGGSASDVADADLQGCINLAMRQQSISSPGELLALSCANGAVASLSGIEHYPSLRFLDLANNRISDLSSLGALAQLSGLNLPGNSLTDISPLLDMASLAVVNLAGNSSIPCAQLDFLQARLGNGLTRDTTCRP